RGIEATLQLAQSTNSKVVIIGSGKDGLPIILGNVDTPLPPAAGGPAGDASPGPHRTTAPSPASPTERTPAANLPTPTEKTPRVGSERRAPGKMSEEAQKTHSANTRGTKGEQRSSWLPSAADVEIFFFRPAPPVIPPLKERGGRHNPPR